MGPTDCNLSITYLVSASTTLFSEGVRRERENRHWWLSYTLSLSEISYLIHSSQESAKYIVLPHFMDGKSKLFKLSEWLFKSALSNK